jgi:DnaJ-class molecular chaperone
MNLEILKCNHKYIDGSSAIEYYSTYEMRSWDMYCQICKKEGSREELEEEQNHWMYCPDCDGKGYIKYDGVNGSNTLWETCDTCKGERYFK